MRRRGAYIFLLISLGFLGHILNDNKGFGKEAGQISREELIYKLPPGWLIDPIQAGPTLIAHYTYYQSGKPYAELYIMKESRGGEKSLTQVFEEALEKGKPSLPYYQPQGTQRIMVAGAEAILHDFTYLVGGNVLFYGRVYVMIVDDMVYSFFFNTPNSHFSWVQNSFSEVMNSVQISKSLQEARGIKPEPEKPLICEEYGLIFELPQGWSLSSASEGAKYRYYSPQGMLLCSLSVSKLEEMSSLFAVFESPSSQLERALEKRKNETYSKFQGYSPLATIKSQVAGFESLIHDFNFQDQNLKGFYRAVFIAVKEKDDTREKRYFPVVHEFAFMSLREDRLEGMKAQMDEIIRSIRLKGSLPPQSSPKETSDFSKPSKPEFPLLVYIDDKGRFQIPLPPETELFRREGKMTSYKIRSKKGYFQIWNLDSFDEMEKIDLINRDLYKVEKGPFSEAISTNLEGKEFLFHAYSGKDPLDRDIAFISAWYSEIYLLIIITVPLDEYESSLNWINDFLKGVDYLKE